MTTRPTKFLAVLLAALLGASGGVASFAACPHATVEAHAQPATHDCCHAQHAHAASRDESSPAARHASERGVVQGEPEGARHSHETGCAEQRDGDSARAGSRNDSGAPCADCCAPLIAQTNTPSAASTRTSSRADDARDADASLPPTFLPPRRYEIAPTQHAPPAPGARLHALNGVLLI